MRSEAWQSSVCELLKATTTHSAPNQGPGFHHLGNEGCFFPNNLGEKGVLTSSGELSKNFYFKTDRLNLPQGPPVVEDATTSLLSNPLRPVKVSSSGSFLVKTQPNGLDKIGSPPQFLPRENNQIMFELPPKSHPVIGSVEEIQKLSAQILPPQNGKLETDSLFRSPEQ